MATPAELSSAYNYFYFIDSSDAVKIAAAEEVFLRTNRGRSSKNFGNEEYAIENVDGLNVLCLKTNYKAYTYSLVFDDETLQINNVLYSDLSNVLTNGKHVECGLFSFTGSKPVEGLESVGRCDVSMNGPSVFLREDDDGHGSGFNSNVVSSMGDLQRFQPVISVDGVGHIIYVELKSTDKEDFDVNKNNMPKTSRTLYENFKQILEWSILADEPWNSTEEISVKAKEFLTAVHLPNDVKADLMNNQADMQIANYLKGAEDARKRPDTSVLSDPSEIFTSWAKRFFIYQSLDELLENVL